jgi:hypothetical protein
MLMHILSRATKPMPSCQQARMLTINQTFRPNFQKASRVQASAQTIAHEGSHIEDDMHFLNSYDAATGHYNPGLNFTHFDTEFQAFEAGSGVKAYPMFPRGPRGYQQLEDYIYRAYPNADDLVFPPAEYPQ